MKILLVNTSDRNGGAAVAASRLFQALNSKGVEAKMLVRDKKSTDNRVVSINSSFVNRLFNYFRFVWERFVIFINNGFSKENLFQVSLANTGVDITKLSEFAEADIIHLHWVNQGFLSLKDIQKIILSGKPIVWTMHDMWCFTGICHYAGNCTNFEGHCKYCPQHRDFFVKMALQRQGVKAKLGRINYVGCSKWIVDQALKSSLLSKALVRSIPNTIDMSVFRQYPRYDAREKLGLENDKKYILFGAAKITDPRKGATYLKDACDILLTKYPEMMGNVELLLLGGKKADITNFFPIKIKYLGYQDQEEQIALIYNAADLFVIPSLEDNLPNTIMESLSCGTPCVGFKTGGIPEMINHLGNGYLAEYKSSKDLAEGIRWVLNQDTVYIAKQCVEFVKDNYSYEIVVQQYKELYSSILK